MNQATQDTELQAQLARIAPLRAAIGQAIVGQQDVVEQLLIGLLAGGHCLLEGVPGLGKTLLVRSLGEALHLQFRRVQFTPDLMPSDILGTELLEEDHGTGHRHFRFQQGPIFTHLLLADELNRTPPTTQAALLEAMQERTVSYAGTTYALPSPFFVLATQNPLEQAGTYPLPEAQLDRFLFKIKLDYPTLDEETMILTRYKEQIKAPDLASIVAIFTADELRKVQSVVEKIIIEDRLIQYIAQIVNKTRNHSKIYLGGSPRASLSILKAAKAFAAIRGRDFVTPDDIQFVTVPVLNHRLILTPEAEMEGTQMEEVIREIVQTIEVPR